MRIIKIAALSNGAHNNQTTSGTLSTIPEGWALIPDDMDTPNFPFGEVEVEEVGGVMVVTKWTAGIIPEVEPTPEPTTEPSVWDELDAAYQEGVNTAYDE